MLRHLQKIHSCFNFLIQVERVDVCFKDGKCSLLIDTSQGMQRILIPSKYEADVIDHYHKLNHLGLEAIMRFSTASFCFYNMKRKIRERVKACLPCQRAKIYRQIMSPLTSCKCHQLDWTSLMQTFMVHFLNVRVFLICLCVLKNFQDLFHICTTKYQNHYSFCWN